MRGGEYKYAIRLHLICNLAVYIDNKELEMTYHEKKEQENYEEDSDYRARGGNGAKQRAI